MNLFFHRAFGILLIVTAVLGLAVSVAGLVLIGRFARDVTAAVNAGFDIGDRALAATADGLDTAHRSLLDAQTTIRGIETTVASLGGVLQEVSPSLEAINKLLGRDLPEAIDATQTALRSAEAAARTVDSFLDALSKIPLIGSAVYQPDTPLHTSIGGVNTSLNGIPSALVSAESGVGAANQALSDFTTGVTEMESQMGTIAGAAGSGLEVIERYQGIVADVQAQFAGARKTTVGWIQAVRWGVTLLLVWMALAQLGLASQGAERLRPLRREE